MNDAPILEPLQPMPPSWAIWFKSLVTTINAVTGGLSSFAQGLVLFGDGSGVQTDSTLSYDGSSLYTPGLVLSKDTGKGIRVDDTAPTFGWRDIIGEINPKSTGAGTPALTIYRGNIAGMKFIANDIADCVFHIPHDYVPGSDLFLHVHWSHNGTAISGSAVWTHYSTYAKGHNQVNFPAEVTNTITISTPDIATVPQYRHRVDEIQLSSVGGSAALLKTEDIEVDGLVLIRLKLTTLPTITGGSLFGHTADIHYQSTNMATKQKAPGFYS